MPAASLNTSRITRHLATSEGVYGLILLSGLIATASATGATSLHVLRFGAVTLGVFWLAHVYAGVVARHGRRGADGTPMALAEVIRESVLEARGMLVTAVFPAAALVLGVTGVMSNKTANWCALWTCVGVLACLGYLSYRRQDAPLYVRLLGAVATASFGLVIIVAKAVVTH